MSAVRDSLSNARASLLASWQGLGEKDRRALTLLAAIGIPLLLIAGLWLPAKQARQQAEAERDSAQALVSWIRREAPRLQGMSTARISPAELPQRVQTLATAQSLTLERLEADPAGLRVAINNARLTSVVAFLQLCRNQGIKVLEAQIVRDAAGTGNQVRLRLGA